MEGGGCGERASDRGDHVCDRVIVCVFPMFQIAC